MTPEANFRRRLVSGMSNYGRIEPVENECLDGMPDVNYCLKGIEGWIELKCKDSWPKKSQTTVSIKHYTPVQKQWALEQTREGGQWFLFLKIDKDYLLFTGESGLLVGTKNKQWMLENCIKHWHGSVDYYRLFRILTRG